MPVFSNDVRFQAQNTSLLRYGLAVSEHVVCMEPCVLSSLICVMHFAHYWVTGHRATCLIRTLPKYKGMVTYRRTKIPISHCRMILVCNDNW